MSLSMVDHYRHGAFAPYLKEVRPVGGIVTLDIVQPPGDFSDPPVEELVLIDNCSRYRANCDFGGGKKRYHSDFGLLAVIAPGVPTSIIADDPHHFRAVTFSPATIGALVPELVARTGCIDVAPLSAAAFRNPLIEALSLRIWAESSEPSARGALYVETAANMILLEIACTAGHHMKPSQRLGLAPWQLRVAKEIMISKHDCEISIAMIARELRISVEHFCRAFKASEGVPPYRWLMNMRLDRGAELLLATERSLTDIAMSVGFNEAGGFVRGFRRRFGKTPNAWRREQK